MCFVINQQNPLRGLDHFQQPIHTKSFINKLHLVLQIRKILFHFNVFKQSLNLAIPESLIMQAATHGPKARWIAETHLAGGREIPSSHRAILHRHGPVRG